MSRSSDDGGSYAAHPEDLDPYPDSGQSNIPVGGHFISLSADI